MKKEDNKLNVDVLKEGLRIFNQFNEIQQEQIMLGLENNVDISIYAKDCFDFEQMEQIRLGLEANLDVSLYANPEYNWEQMKELRLKLLEERKNKNE
mgnify:CR=1 FL=1